VRFSIAAAAAWAAQIPSLAGIAPDGRPAVKLCVEIGTPDPWVTRRGEFIAQEIYSQIGIRLDWSHRTQCREGDGILIHVGSAPSPAVHPSALAYAWLARARIEVFYDRIAASAAPLAAPDLMGHVLAHEIAHVLQGVVRHSEEGIMKAHWTQLDYERMRPHPMQFAPEDVALIRAGMLGR